VDTKEGIDEKITAVMFFWLALEEEKSRRESIIAGFLIWER